MYLHKQVRPHAMSEVRKKLESYIKTYLKAYNFRTVEKYQKVKYI